MKDRKSWRAGTGEVARLAIAAIYRVLTEGTYVKVAVRRLGRGVRCHGDGSYGGVPRNLAVRVNVGGVKNYTPRNQKCCGLRACVASINEAKNVLIPSVVQ